MIVRGEGVHDRHGFRAMEVDVIADPPAPLLAGRQLLSGLGVLVLAQREEVILARAARKPKPLGKPPLPVSRQLLVAHVIVGLHQGVGEIRLGVRAATAQDHADHLLSVK